MQNPLRVHSLPDCIKYVSRVLLLMVGYDFIFSTSSILMEASADPVATYRPSGLNLATLHAALCVVMNLV